MTTVGPPSHSTSTGRSSQWVGRAGEAITNNRIVRQTGASANGGYHTIFHADPTVAGELDGPVFLAVGAQANIGGKISYVSQKIVRKLDTSAAALVGDPVYIGADGVLLFTPPASAKYIKRVGTVLVKDAAVGIVSIDTIAWPTISTVLGEPAPSYTLRLVAAHGITASYTFKRAVTVTDILLHKLTGTGGAGDIRDIKNGATTIESFALNTIAANALMRADTLVSAEVAFAAGDTINSVPTDVTDNACVITVDFYYTGQ